MAELTEDERFAQLESEKDAALKEMESTYDSMISKTDQLYQSQVDKYDEVLKQQTELQNQQTDFALQQIEQQKAQAEKDYQKQQSAAYVDWRKQSNQYGPEAEKMAAAGLQRTGYSESSQVAMYNAYQNRVATARSSFDQVVLGYNNAMTEAKLQNSSVLAQLALSTLQSQLQLTLEGFNYQNQLLLDKLAQKAQIDDRYYARNQDLIAQIEYEKSKQNSGYDGTVGGDVITLTKDNISDAAQKVLNTLVSKQNSFLYDKNGVSQKGRTFAQDAQEHAYDAYYDGRITQDEYGYIMNYLGLF